MTPSGSSSFHADPPGDRTHSRQRSWGRMGAKQLARLCHNVGTSLHAGLDVVRVWETESQRGSTLQRLKMAEVHRRIAQGSSVAEALAATEGYIPSLVVEMAEVGERTGRIEQVFLRLGEHYDRLVKLQRDFLIGIAWPLFELTLGIVIIGVLILVLGLIGGPGEGESFSVLGLSGWSGLVIYSIIIVTIVTGIAGLIFGVRQGIISLDPLLRILMQLPFLGRHFQTLALSRLIWSLSMATDSDLDPRRAMELAIRTTQSSYYTSHIEGMKLIISRGGEMTDAFRQTGIYPSDFLDSLHTGEVTGNLSETLAILARDYEERAKNFYRMIAVVSGLLIFLLIAGIMIFMIFTLFFTFILNPIQTTLDSM